MCGGCKENYSLAIGSSHCIHCPNNNNLALLTFFAAAGILLVFIISALNLTVTQGLINGLIFYANIVWTYQSLFFPHEQKSNTVLILLKIFIAWINIDFGIETYFIDGLTAFWKTWLQFVFPFYILAISVLIIVVMKHSVRLTMLVGDRAVPVLDSLYETTSDYCSCTGVFYHKQVPTGIDITSMVHRWNPRLLWSKTPFTIHCWTCYIGFLVTSLYTVTVWDAVASKNISF